MKKLQYSMYIRWSDEDECYIAWMPEFGPTCHTHGDTYEEAAKNGREVLELIMSSEHDLPEPFKYGAGHPITPPSHESEELPPDWYESFEKSFTPEQKVVRRKPLPKLRNARVS